jgi:hypothetical protein
MEPDRWNAEERALWERVCELWALAARRDVEAVRAALHPRYAGWEAHCAMPHDREFAVRSIAGDAPRVVRYALDPKSVAVYDARTGVAHYTYSATLAGEGGAHYVTGRWTEVYVNEAGKWLMVAVQGGPDLAPGERWGKLPGEGE